MSLYQYLVRLETILVSRQDIEVRLLKIDAFTLGVKFTSELCFHDGSCLSIAMVKVYFFLLKPNFLATMRSNQRSGSQRGSSQLVNHLRGTT